MTATRTDPVITGVGKYISRDGERVRIISVAEGFAMGLYGREMFVRTWRVSGSAYGDGHEYCHDIVGPYAPPRKPLVGWVSIYPGSYAFTDKGEDYAQYHAGVGCKEVVPVREYDPAAEAEARKLQMAHANRPFFDDTDYKGICRALSLLLPAIPVEAGG